MAERLRIHTVGGPDAEVPLLPGPARVGRSASCQVRIEHPEIGQQVALIDYRGGAYFLQNLCPYDIYVGQQPLRPNAWSQWRIGDELRLTKSISLSLSSGPAETAAPAAAVVAEEKTAAKTVSDSGRKMIQLGVTIACVVLGVLFLMADQGLNPSVETPDTFADLIAELNQNHPLRRSDEIIRDDLQAAWMLDRRANASEGRADAVGKYQSLLKTPEIRAASMDRNSIHSRIKVFAARRIAFLSKTK